MMHSYNEEIHHDEHQEAVLILVLMDDALVPCKKNLENYSKKS